MSGSAVVVLPDGLTAVLGTRLDDHNKPVEPVLMRLDKKHELDKGRFGVQGVSTFGYKA
jgi:hypothetical protein